MTEYRRVQPISADHDVEAFDCGSEAPTQWLRRHALQAHRSDTAKVYVICRRGTNGRYPAPVVILTRLGVDIRDQGRGLGQELVRDALLQAASVAARIGVRAVLIHAETSDAAAFYHRISTAFEASPTDPLHLVLLMKDLRATIASAAKSG